MQNWKYWVFSRIMQVEQIDQVDQEQNLENIYTTPWYMGAKYKLAKKFGKQKYSVAAGEL